MIKLYEDHDQYKSNMLLYVLLDTLISNNVAHMFICLSLLREQFSSQRHSISVILDPKTKDI